MFSRITGSPVLVRIVPFIVFILLTFAQDKFGEAGRYWFYLGKTVVGAGMVWAVRPYIQEMRWNFSWDAVIVGVLVFVLWVGLDPLLIALGFPGSYPKLTLNGTSWNPQAAFGAHSGLAWFFIVVRVLGSSLVVPPLEEVFFRSFLYRSIVQADFQAVPLCRFLWVPFLVTALIFGLEHREWLAGVLCGMVYQGLVIRRNRVGDAIVAHAITNFLLGFWVVWRGAWGFW